MLPKPVPALTEEQWNFVAQLIDKPASEDMTERLRQAIENASKLRHE